MCYAQSSNQGELDALIRRMKAHLAAKPGELFHFDGTIPIEIVNEAVRAIENENGPVVEKANLDGDDSYIRFRISPQFH